MFAKSKKSSKTESNANLFAESICVDCHIQWMLWSYQPFFDCQNNNNLSQPFDACWVFTAMHFEAHIFHCWQCNYYCTMIIIVELGRRINAAILLAYQLQLTSERFRCSNKRNTKCARDLVLINSRFNLEKRITHSMKLIETRESCSRLQYSSLVSDFKAILALSLTKLTTAITKYFWFHEWNSHSYTHKFKTKCAYSGDSIEVLGNALVHNLYIISIY